MRRVFTTRHFDRWMRKTELTEATLCAAVVEMEHGLVDGDLGGGVVKKRVSLPGRGKSGGARTLVATNREDRWFFVFGFEKNERANVTLKELEGLKRIGADLLKLVPKQLDELIATAAMKEICHDCEEKGH